MNLTEEGWIGEYEKRRALWMHDGNAKRPHALLTSGQHSDGFFNSRLVITDEELLGLAAADLIVLFGRQRGNSLQVNGVVGPQTGATKLAELISRDIQVSRMNNCFWASPAKFEQEGIRSMVFNDKDLNILRNQNVLLCEDVFTTGGSVLLTEVAVNCAGGIVLPFILTLVNRSGLVELGGRKIIALINRPMKTWKPNNCPLCRQGSKVVRPKDNWEALTATY